MRRESPLAITTRNTNIEKRIFLMKNTILRMKRTLTPTVAVISKFRPSGSRSAVEYRLPSEVCLPHSLMLHLNSAAQLNRTSIVLTALSHSCRIAMEGTTAQMLAIKLVLATKLLPVETKAHQEMKVLQAIKLWCLLLVVELCKPLSLAA